MFVLSARRLCQNARGWTINHSLYVLPFSLSASYIVKVISFLCIQRKLHAANTIVCALLYYISRNSVNILCIFVFLKRLCTRAKKYSKWKCEKWKLNEIKCALKSSQHLGVVQFYIYKAHTRYISLNCRRSEKELYNLSYVDLFYSSCLIVRII